MQHLSMFDRQLFLVTNFEELVPPHGLAAAVLEDVH